MITAHQECAVPKEVYHEGPKVKEGKSVKIPVGFSENIIVVF